MEDFHKILQRVAAQHGATPAHVLEEMQRAIELAWESRDETTGPLWDQLCASGERPGPEELVALLALWMTDSGELPQ